MKVQITKVDEHRKLPSSLSYGYTVEGTMRNTITVGDSLFLWRTHRNGVEVPGVFQTSPITFVARIAVGWLVRTENSTYEIKELADV